MTPLDLARQFLQLARQDESLLEVGIDDPRISDSIFGFHAQQACEKSLKAILAIEQVRPRHIHDLEDLLQEIGESVEVPTEVASVTVLTPFAVDNRYPLGSPPAIDRRSTLILVTRVREWAESVVEKDV